MHATDFNRSLDVKPYAFEAIPVIDIAALVTGEDSPQTIEEIAHALQHIGFMYVKNHGVDAALVNAAYQQSAEFFALPHEEKQAVNIVNSGPTLRGYIPMYGENVDPDYTRDFKECFDYGADGDKVSPFFGPNPMPERPEKFAAVMRQYHAAMMQLSRTLVQAIAVSLNLPKDYFANRQQNPITIQRMLHYPPQEGVVRLEEMGIGAHTDYGFLTILAQDNNGGLQVQNADGDWIAAPPIEDTFVINIGDLVQTLTHGRYRSTLHRVINSSGNERYSMAFFLDMDFDAVIEPVPTCIKPGEPLPFEPYTCGAHKYQRFVDSYEHLQQEKQET